MERVQESTGCGMKGERGGKRSSAGALVVG